MFSGVLLHNCYEEFLKEIVADSTWVQSTIATTSYVLISCAGI